MATLKEFEIINNILEVFTQNTTKPENFLSVQNDTALSQRRCTKDLYDLIKSEDHDADHTSDALPELIIDNFDDEQIWQQIELQNESMLSRLLPGVAQVAASKLLTFNIGQNAKRNSPTKRSQRKDKSIELKEDDDVDDDEESINSEDFTDNENIESAEEEDDDDVDAKGLFGDDGYNSDESEEEVRLKKLLDEADANEESDPDEEDESDNQSDIDFDFEVNKDLEKDKIASNSGLKKEKKRKTVVDDTFFKLADMETFLEQEDLKEERKHNKLDDSDEESGDESLDMWGEDEEKDDSARHLKYSDFFDNPEDEMTQEDKPMTKKVKFQDEQDETENMEEGSGSEDMEIDAGLTDNAPKQQDLFESESEGEDVADILGQRSQSNFEKRQEKMKATIATLESRSLSEKPWQLTGEVAAAARPFNSLLEQDLDYEQQSKQAPVITEETTLVLEDMIKQRIKDKAWDDVERKTKTKENVYEYKKRIILDQEKSKQSLAEVYEEQYIKQTQKDEEEKTDPMHEEIRTMMQSVFIKLDALSNFHFAPKPCGPELKVINNMASIAMEEVAPVSTSSTQQLAPEEIKEKEKQQLKGDSEKTSVDKKRARREKKQRQRQKKLAREKKEKAVDKANPGLGNKYAKQKAMKDLERQSKSGKGVSIIKDNVAGKRSSSQFFTQLQDEVSSQISKQRAEKKKSQKKKLQQSAAKLKL